MTAKKRLSRRSTAEEVTAGLDLTGKVALVTGANSGLGLESMRVLALRGAHVIGAARTLEKAAQACDSIDGTTTPVACELSDLGSVAACADLVSAGHNSLDILMCNAGIMALPTLEQVNGIEMQFATNHLGHFVLINRLLAQVMAAEQGRVVILSSAGHTHTVAKGIDFDNLSGETGYDSWKFYGQSKLANLLTASELARRLGDSSATSYSVHPGVIRTNLARNTSGLFSRIISTVAPLFERTLAQGAATQCFAATAPGINDLSGAYLANCRQSRPSRHGQSQDLARRLWQVSEQLTAAHL